MADDHSQRPYRASEPPVRGSAKAPGSDPLAELARLIGQTDPFGEFGRENARRAAAPPPAESADWDAPINSPYAPRSGADRSFAGTQNYAGNGQYPTRSAASQHGLSGTQNYNRESYGRQPLDDAPLPAVVDDPYDPQHEAHGYAPGQAEYQQEGYDYNPAHQGGEEYYAEAPPSRWRLGVTAIVGVLALAVIGTAGAFGYRALFGLSSSSQSPPVIKADAGPNKIVPATTANAQSGKLITDRINDRGQGEKLVSREEQPMDRPAGAMLTPAAPQAVVGSGVVSNEPKKIRTIAIHPDQPTVADAQPPAPPLAAAPVARSAPAAPAPAAAKPVPPPARVDASTADAEQNAPAPAPARPAPPQARQAAPASNSAPLSLSPDAGPARPAGAQTRTASVAAPAAVAPAAPAAASTSNPGSGSFVQVSSQRSEAEAQTAFRDLQAKYPNQLGGRQAVIHMVDLGVKGTYYRAMIGPFTNSSEAGDLCSSLKAAGGQCLIQRN